MRILGIDLGSSSIKAVEVDSAFGRYEIRDYYEQKLTPGMEPTEAAMKLIRGLPRTPDRIAVAMPTSTVTFRNLTLPTRNKKAIQAAIGFELEDELPFSLENTAFDYSLISQSKQTAIVHVAATLKRNITSFLEKWSAAGIDPDLLTTEAWAYRTLLNRIAQHPSGHQIAEEPVLLVRMGHARTTLYVHSKGTPVLAKELSWGGRDLTLAICQKYNIPLDQAEQAKMDHGFVIPATQKSEATPEQLEFSETLATPLQTLIREIRQVTLTCKSTTKQNISTIYVAGGTSLLPGLSRIIEETLQIPVRPMLALSSTATSGVTYSEHTDATFVLAVSLALCMVGAERTTTINFRKGALAKQAKAREINLKNLRQVALGTGAVLTCMFVSLFVQSRVYKSRLADLNTQLERSVKSFFGNLSSSAVRTYMANTSTLRSSINKELNKQRELAKLIGPNPHSPVDFLRSISLAISKDAVVDLTVFQVGASASGSYAPSADGSASLTFLMHDPKTADRLSSFLGPKLTDLQKGKIEEVPGPEGTKRWKMTFSGKPTEASYGN